MVVKVMKKKTMLKTFHVPKASGFAFDIKLILNDNIKGPPKMA